MNCLSNSAGSIFNSLLHHGDRVFAIAEIMEHGEQRIPAPLLVDVIADSARLEIADDHLLRRGGMYESAIQLRHRQQLLILDRQNYVRTQPVAPIRRDRRLFVDRHAFRKPARHAVSGRGRA